MGKVAPVLHGDPLRVEGKSHEQQSAQKLGDEHTELMEEVQQYPLLLFMQGGGK